MQEVLRESPFSGAIYVFRSKRANRVKLLWWDGTGICMLTKRLENGQFRWPAIADGTMPLTREQLSMLLEGMEWRHTQSREIVRPSVVQ